MVAIPANSEPHATHANPTHALTRAVAIAIAVAGLTLLGVALLAARRDVWLGFVAASIVSIGAAAASVPVVAMGMRYGVRRPEIVTAAYFAALFARALISLGGAVAAILLAGYPKTPTLLMVVPYYFSILTAETLVVARLLLKGDAGAENKHA